LCGGRLVVGVGGGYRRVEFDAFGVRMAGRRNRGLRALDEMIAWWDGAEVRDTGARLGIRPASRPHMPIWLAASGPRTYLAAVDRRHTPFLGPQIPLARLGEILGAQPLPKSVALRRDVLLTDVVGKSAVASALAARSRQYGDWGYASSSEQSPYLVGSAAECRQRVSELEALGVTDLVIRTNWPGITSEASREMLAAFAG
jgi:alkanesulfonate monooxygenase SsuD/methylene tetrahydromethanopterin reductase-like flavin-dependent oxidoreductase (luciferase family)